VEIFKFIEQNGYGKDKNTGCGSFEIHFSEHKWKMNFQSNAWLVLSNFVPSKDDSNNILYDGFTKHPKTGGSFAITDSPFKYPIFMMKPGSVVVSDKKPSGILLRNIHPDNSEIVQNLYCYSIPFKIKEGEIV